MILLTACSNKAISVINPSCSGFGLIQASRQDTTETLRQIAVHNATYRAICQEDKNDDGVIRVYPKALGIGRNRHWLCLGGDEVIYG